MPTSNGYGQSEQPYKYNAKEFVTMHGYDSYDYGARLMTPGLGFTSIDPLAEKYPENSPYVYCASNPVRYVDPDGNVGIGTALPDHLLTVNGIIHAKEILIELSGPLADYVFDSRYVLMPLNDLNEYVKTHKHLPDMPSAADVSSSGISVGDMQNKLLQKVEELTLHTIRQQEEIDALKKEIKNMTQAK